MANNRNKLVLSGGLGVGGGERWSIGIHYTLAGGGSTLDPEVLQNWAESAMAYWEGEDNSNTLLNMLSDVGFIDTVDTYGYGVEPGPAAASGQATGAVPGFGDPSFPPQVSMVFTLLTGFAGRSFRGRAYWPTLRGNINDNLSTNTGGMAAAFADALEGMGLASLGPQVFVPVVYSPKLFTVTEVTQVRVGNVLDTQRRRRDALTEVYSVAPVG